MKIYYRKAGIFFITFCFIGLLTSSCAVTEKRARKPGDMEACRCDVRSPERIILNVTEDPSKSLAVTWRTWVRVSRPEAQVLLVADSLGFKENLKTIEARCEKVGMRNETFVYHYSAILQNLRPDTIYAYRVGSEGNWSEWNHFKTACNIHEPFSFVYLGDPQNDIKSMCSRIFRAAYKKAPDADFWLFVGDLVNNGDKDEQWAELFYALGWISRMTPMMLLPGNHEYPDKRYIQGKDYKLFNLWRPHFTLPENGPQGLEETVYFIDYQGVRFVMLNGNEKIEEQASWLRRILADNPQTWTIAAIHQPVYSTARLKNRSKFQTTLAPVFDEYAVDLVLQGHDHTYCRTYKIRNGVRAEDNEKGTVYVISVSGPKFYQIKTHYQDLMAKIEVGRQLFQVIQIDHNRLSYKSYDDRGEVFDSFSLEK